MGRKHPANARCDLCIHLEGSDHVISDDMSILLVDDDECDLMAVRRSFRSLDTTNPVAEAHNGVETLQHLRGGNGLQSLVSPSLVPLDLKMPRTGGGTFIAAPFTHPRAMPEPDLAPSPHNLADVPHSTRASASFVNAVSASPCRASGGRSRCELPRPNASSLAIFWCHSVLVRRFSPDAVGRGG